MVFQDALFSLDEEPSLVPRHDHPSKNHESWASLNLESSKADSTCEFIIGATDFKKHATKPFSATRQPTAIQA